MKWLKAIWNRYKERQALNKCSQCGKPFSRLEWGGRLHVTRNGSTYLHPIDYVVTYGCKTLEEKRAEISKLEQTDRLINKLQKK